LFFDIKLISFFDKEIFLTFGRPEMDEICSDMNDQLDIISSVILELRSILNDVSASAEPPENGIDGSMVSPNEWVRLRVSEAQIARSCEIRARLLRLKKAARSCTIYTIKLQQMSRRDYTEALGHGVLDVLHGNQMTTPFTIEDIEDIMPDASSYARQHKLMMQDLNRAMSEL
jgi:hypothetical protein